ncbi:hypothetical protein GCM10022254_19280 [Actinomadura meridiana]|uniref:Uncharacterized protein n=1 Tax=Actinomadura meridiana TaxID=559626 RepID=A0ABP8BWJ0_9ACTN
MRKWGTCLVASAGIVAAVVAVAPSGSAVEVRRAPGAVVVDEPFTGGAADTRFVGYGTACLTGAPRGKGEAEATNHRLRGCRRDPVGPVPPGDAAPRGYLQLTDAHDEQTGAVLFDSPIPAAGGLDVSFEQWQYGNTTRGAADGLSFFLVDGSTSLTTPGAFGGSLGYAQRLPGGRTDGMFIPGVNGGYLGIGLDVLGEYFGDGEGRGNGCDRRSPAGTEYRQPAPGPNIVTARGPGNGVEGYCLIAATNGDRSSSGAWGSSLPGNLHGRLKSMPANVSARRAESLLEPVKRTVHVVVSPDSSPMVTVDIDFQDGKGFQPVLRFRAPEPVPDTVKFGFASSTGARTDVHLIRRVVVRGERGDDERSR